MGFLVGKPGWRALRLGPMAWLPAVLPVFAALVLALAGGLWWWSAQEGSLRTALQTWAPAGLQAEGVTGSLRHGGSAERLRWQSGPQDWAVEAEQLSVQWSLSDALTQWAEGRPRLQLPLLQAERLRITPASSKPADAPPNSLALPLTVSIAQIRIAQLHWSGSARAQGIEASYRYEQRQHALSLRQMRLAEGSYSGQFSLQDQRPLALQAQIEGLWQARLPQGRTLPLKLQASANGPIEKIDLRAQLSGGQGSQADVHAVITAWQPQMVPQADARFAQLDLALLWPGMPRTRLGGKVEVVPEGQNWRFAAQLNNTASGPYNEGQLPLDTLDAAGVWQDGQWLLERADGRLGDARVQARGQVSANGWQGQARFEGLQPSRIDSRWPPQTLEGQADASLAQGALQFDVRLIGRGDARGALAGWALQQAWAQGQWKDGVLQLQKAGASSAQARIEGTGNWHSAQQSGRAQWQLQAPGLSLQGQASWPLAQDAGQLALSSADTQAALRWLRSQPGLPAGLVQSLGTLQARGRSDVSLQWAAGLQAAQVQARLALSSLSWGAEPTTLSGVELTLQGPLSAAAARGQLAWQDGARRWLVKAQGQLALPERLGDLPQAGLASLNWRGLLEQLQIEVDEPATGRWQLVNPANLNLSGRGSQWQVEPGRLRLQPPERGGLPPVDLAWSRLQGQPGQWASTGTLQALPMSWLTLVAGSSLTRSPLSGNLIFDGQWDLRMGEQLALEARLSRRSGDLSLHAEGAQGLAAQVAAGVRVAELQLRGQGQALSLNWRWDSERAGRAEGQINTRLQRTGDQWQWPASAPLQGQISAQLPRLGVWTALAPPGWRLRGSLGAQLRVGGTRAQPLLYGELQADDLALRSVVDGIELGRGKLRARLDGQQLLLDELSLRGAGEDGGSVQARAQMQWSGERPRVDAQIQLQRLRASVRSDRLLTMSGEVQAAMRGMPGQQPVEVTGALRVDQARISVPDEERPQLGGDVQVRRSGAAPTPPLAGAKPTPGAGMPPLKLAVGLDLGSDFVVEGRGLNTRLRGALQLSGDGQQSPRVQGQVSSVDGQYRAYGQRLQIERGLLRFSGAIDNPALDIVALRPNLTQKVGVQVSGTALLPRVRLYADPELPEAEKLAWLVLGRASSTGGAEAAVLQQAALALLGNRNAQNREALTNSLGLDEISLRGASTQADGSTTGGGVALGKRLSSNFYALYESGLAGSMGTLYLFYELSQRLTVRAQTGAQTAVDLIYTLSYD